MAGKKIIAVFGATGAQGGAVVDTFLSDPKLKDEWKVRGVTRDVSKESAKKLASKGVEVVAANLDDKESLVKAMTGVAAVFAVTNYWEKINMQDEIQQGKNLADAAKETGVQHFIWSSLYDVNKLTNGRLDKVYHFDGKAKVEEYIRSLGMPATFFMPGFYLGNIDAGMLRQMPPDNAWTFALPTPEDAPIPLFHAGDTGKYVKAIVLNRDTLLGERVHASAEYKTPAEIIGEFKKAFPQDGATARFFSVPHEAFLAAIKGNTPAFVGDATKELPDYVAEELLQNMRLFAEGGYYGGASLEPTLKLVQGVGEKLTTWADYLKISKAFKDLK